MKTLERIIYALPVVAALVLAGLIYSMRDNAARQDQYAFLLVAVVWLVVGGVALTVYFLPAIVASGKNHFNGILLLNLFLGWTFVGWVGALVWAVCEKKEA